MLNTILSWLYSAITLPFNILESSFGLVGLSFLVVFTIMIVSGFLVRNFLRIFYFA